MARSYATANPLVEPVDICGDGLLKTLDRLRQLLEIDGFGEIT
jgi:hypothetical protein